MNIADAGATADRPKQQKRVRFKIAPFFVAAMTFAAWPNSSWAECAKVTEVKIQEWPGGIYNIVPWVADAEGLVRKGCLTVRFVPLAGGPSVIPALVNGSVDFANQAPDVNMRPRSKGVDVRMISNMYASHWSALIASKQAVLPPLKDGYPTVMQDLVGKEIGVTVLGGSLEAYMRSAFDEARLKDLSVTYIVVGGVATAVPALEHNLVDAEILSGAGPELAEALSAGKIVLDFRVKGVGPMSMQALWGATLGWHAYGSFIDKIRMWSQPSQRSTMKRSRS